MKMNLTARAARWSAAHWKTATLCWVVFVALAMTAGTLAGKVGLTDSENATGETARAEAMLENAGFTRPAGESVLVQSATRTADDPAFARTLHRVERRLGSLPQVGSIRAPRLSADRRSALVEFELRGDPASASDRVQPVLQAVSNMQRGSPGFTVAEFGEASADHQLQRRDRQGPAAGGAAVATDHVPHPADRVRRLRRRGPPCPARVLGRARLDRARRADEPRLARLGRGLLRDPADRDGGGRRLLALLRQARARGTAARPRPATQALARAAATSGMAVLVSGATVLIAMAGMLMSGSAIFTSLGIASMVVVVSAMVGSLTVLPALLGKLGDRLDRGVLGVLAATLHRVLRVVGIRSRLLARARDRRTVLQRLKGDAGRSRIWDAILRPVLAHPWVAARRRDVGAGRPFAPGARPAHEAARSGRPAAEHPGREHVLEDRAGVPRLADARRRRRQGARRARSAGAIGDRRPPPPRGRDAAHAGARHRGGQPGAHDRARRDPAARQRGRRRTRHARSQALRTSVLPATIGRLPNAEHRRHRARRRATRTSTRR